MRAKKDRPTKAALTWMGRIKAMACICCRLLEQPQTSQTEVHHIREDREARSDFLVIPVCAECHWGPNGIHGSKTYLRLLKMSEWGLLALVIRELAT